MNRRVTLLGIPWDEGSSFMRGAAAGPAAIRRALTSPATNLSTETGPDLVLGEHFADAGDLTLSEGDHAATGAAIAAAVAHAVESGGPVLALGGDHAITHPVVRAHAGRYGPLSILHLDAHPDLYEDFEGQPWSHASPFARILEAGLASRLVQVGIRTLNDRQRPQVRRYGVEQFEMRRWEESLALTFDGPVYVSLDLDVLDPAFAPGVAHHEPGGLSVREVLRILHAVKGEIVGGDVVELNPSRDRDGITAAVAAKLVKEMVARMR